MDLIVWILIGIVVNTLFLKDDLLKNKETLLAGIVIVIIRAITGGLISNFLFEGGIGSLDFPTFAMTGLAPIVLLLLVKIYNLHEAQTMNSEAESKSASLQRLVLSH